MQGDNVSGLSAPDTLSIIAYILETNGFPAGNEDLKADENAIKAMVLNDTSSAKKTHVKSAAGSDPVNSLGVSEAYYTEEQAERGKPYFHAACGACHAGEASGPNG